MATRGPLALIADDEAQLRRLLELRLRALGCQVAQASTGREALRMVEQELPALLLLDLQMPEMDGMAVLRHLKQADIDLPVIVITAHGSIEAVVEAMKAGAYDFLPKPFDPAHLEVVVRKALERRRLLESNQLLRDTLEARTSEVLGESPSFRQAVETARKAAAASSTVLLLGESGTGKEVFAQAIHRWGPRREHPFVVVNCVALSEHLLESELFGHEKGAFTGAHQAKKGKFEVADRGTLFLDEIGDMPLGLQTKLLRVLQDHTFDRVGGTRPIQVDLRILAATNQDLEAAVRAKRFREDLYYRLNVIQIPLPPLRERREDIPLLANHFVAKSAADTKKPMRGLTPDALAFLLQHSWPGNVRELANALERAVVLCSGEWVGLDDLAMLRPSACLGGMPGSTPGPAGLHAQVKAYKRALVEAALVATGGNQTKAAALLGLQRTYLSKLLRLLKIRVPEPSAPEPPR
jgi:DNA-binding NtrC family response regulator